MARTRTRRRGGGGGERESSKAEIGLKGMWAGRRREMKGVREKENEPSIRFPFIRGLGPRGLGPARRGSRDWLEPARGNRRRT